MPQLSPMKWFSIYLMMLIIMILFMINMNFLNNFFLKSTKIIKLIKFNKKWKF